MSGTTWTCRGTVLRIIDGDTFAADFDLGWGVWLHEITGHPNRVRLLGIDTPERGQAGYQEATDQLKAAIPPGTTIWIESDRLDSFGRTLGTVRLADGVDVLDLLPSTWRG